MSKISGVDASNRSCSLSSDCEVNEVCGKRRGMMTGRCHARSRSLQDAWALAAVEVEEPKCAVEKNGVTFHPQDIKALVTQLYFQSERINIAMFGRQPREISRFGADYSIHCDRTYSITYEPWYCRNINGREFFTTLTHVVGKLRQPLLIRFDGSAGYFPIIGYRVQEMTTSANISIDSITRATVYTIRLELDWMLSVLDNAEDVKTMRSTVSFFYTNEMTDVKFKGVGNETMTRSLLPVSLEIPVPSILQEDESTKLTIQNVMGLVSASVDCPNPANPRTPRACNAMPYNLELRRLREQVERCEAATQFSFSGSQQPVLSRLCVNADCREVLDALRRIEYRGCVLPNGLDIIRLLDGFYSVCVGIAYARPLDVTTSAPSPSPTGATEAPEIRKTRVPRVRTSSPSWVPPEAKLLDGSSDQSKVVVSHSTTLFDIIDINSTNSAPNPSPSLQQVLNDRSPANVQHSSDRPTQQPTQQPAENMEGGGPTEMRPPIGAVVVSDSNTTLREHLNPPVDVLAASPSTEPTPPVAISRGGRGSLPSFLIQLGVVGAFILLGEIVILSFRWRQSKRARKKRHPERVLAPPGLSLWVQHSLVDRYIPPATITDVRLLDRGSSGVVYLVRLNDRQLAASKRLATHRVNDSTAQQQLIDEIKLNASLQHPNIVALIGASWTTRANLQAVFEYLSGGDLLSYLESNRTPERMVWTRAKLQLAMDVAYALAYIHSLLPSPVVHRDLKSRNILLSRTSSTSEITAKLCDFGAARSQSSGDAQAAVADVGTSRWLAPEVILGGRSHDGASDVYSFGVVLTELDTHQVPFSDVQGPEATQLPDATVLWMVAHERLQPSISASCPEPLAALARECMSYEPHERPTASQVCTRLQAIQMEVSKQIRE
ncbi:hypothetical protein PINS_up007757 [Pythium insidiosum]|nr:hypothetical protein PINS_up007757 [Pythium insidiosum]